jgi:hypothetical protein
LSYIFPAEIDILLSKESRHNEEIRELTEKLNLYKTAYSKLRDVEEESIKSRRDWDVEKLELQNEIIVLKVAIEELILYFISTDHRLLQGSERRVVCLIDGDGTIFADDIIARGHEGGYTAAQMLTESIQKYLRHNFSLDQYQLWTYVVYNKRGLSETLGRFNYGSAKAKLDDFMIGFNQAAGRFLMVDVGSGKEAADAKIKGVCRMPFVRRF